MQSIGRNQQNTDKGKKTIHRFWSDWVHYGKYDGNGMSVHLIHIADGISIFELKIARERKLGMFTGSSKERVWRIGSTNIWTEKNKITRET